MKPSVLIRNLTSAVSTVSAASVKSGESSSLLPRCVRYRFRLPPVPTSLFLFLLSRLLESFWLFLRTILAVCSRVPLSSAVSPVPVFLVKRRRSLMMSSVWLPRSSWTAVSRPSFTRAVLPPPSTTPEFLSARDTSVLADRLWIPLPSSSLRILKSRFNSPRTLLTVTVVPYVILSLNL